MKGKSTIHNMFIMQDNDSIMYGLFCIDFIEFMLAGNHLLVEIKHNDLMSEKHKKKCRYLKYVEHLLILASTLTGCISISAFASLVCVPVGITSSAVGLQICAFTAGIKKCQSIIKKKKREHDKGVLLVKTKINTIEILISKF